MDAKNQQQSLDRFCSWWHSFRQSVFPAILGLMVFLFVAGPGQGMEGEEGSAAAPQAQETPYTPPEIKDTAVLVELNLTLYGTNDDSSKLDDGTTISDKETKSGGAGIHLAFEERNMVPGMPNMPKEVWMPKLYIPHGTLNCATSCTQNYERKWSGGSYRPPVGGYVDAGVRQSKGGWDKSTRIQTYSLGVTWQGKKSFMTQFEPPVASLQIQPVIDPEKDTGNPTGKEELWEYTLLLIGEGTLAESFSSMSSDGHSDSKSQVHEETFDLMLTGTFSLGQTTVKIGKENIDHNYTPLQCNYPHDLTLTGTMTFPSKKQGVLWVGPGTGLSAEGPDEKGKFRPSAKTYALKNIGKGDLDFTVSQGRPWVSLSGTEGTLSPGAGTTVKVSINEAANKLDGDEHKDTIRFTNTSNGVGSTTRPVKVEKVERWRVLIDGWDTLYFGGSDLAGGLKVFWRTQIDFAIKGGKYRDGQGKAFFSKLDSYSHPPGIYDCVAQKGVYLDKNLNKHPTPHIKYRAFAVPGFATQSAAGLYLPKENFYYIGYHCVMDTDAAKEAFQGKGAIKPEDRVKSSRKQANIKDARLLPSGNMKVPLQHGFIKKFGRTKSFDAHQIKIIRVSPPP